MDWQALAQQISHATGKAFTVVNARPVSGGDINAAYCLQGKEGAYFVKMNRVALADMFAAEFAGLQELAGTQTVSVPRPVLQGQLANQSFLVLEYLEFGPSNKVSDRLLGEQLARLHQIRQPYFGWQCDNTIGSTPQPNPQAEDWLSFWRDQRIGHQLHLAARNGVPRQLQTLGDKLCADMASFFDHNPQPSLLHGDLWGGNAAVLKNGQPVIFDPACYYGDRETDLAMTELFGGYSQDFYASYHLTWPLANGYKIRKKLYNLYHILNHFNLFGGGYARQAETNIAQLLSEIL